MFSVIAILYCLFWVGILVALIYIIFHQLEKRKEENFEERDN